MSRIEPGRMHQVLYARITGVLNTIEVLEEDFSRCVEEYKKIDFADTAQARREQKEYERRLMKKSNAIRELRRDAIRQAHQAGPKVAEWLADKRYKAIKERDRK